MTIDEYLFKMVARLALLVLLEKVVDANNTKRSPLSPRVVRTKICATYWFPPGFRVLVAVPEFVAFLFSSVRFEITLIGFGVLFTPV